MTFDNSSDTRASRSKKKKKEKLSNAVGDNPVNILPGIPSMMQHSLLADTSPNALAKSSSRVTEGDEEMTHLEEMIKKIASIRETPQRK